MKIIAAMSAACALLAACGGVSQVDQSDAGSPVSVLVSPAGVSLAAGATQAFVADVANANDTRVTWSLQEGAAGGATTRAGDYPGPATAGTEPVGARTPTDQTKTRE